eukprot:scaffold5121_cov42-Prasinocladus_malaysianus.AAC.1
MMNASVSASTRHVPVTPDRGRLADGRRARTIWYLMIKQSIFAWQIATAEAPAESQGLRYCLKMYPGSLRRLCRGDRWAYDCLPKRHPKNCDSVSRPADAQPI